MAQGTTKGVPIDIDPTLSADNDSLVPSQKAIKSYIDLGLSNKVSRNGDTMLGNLILNANPTLALQAVTKDYVDTLINGIDWKQAVNATTVSGLPSYNVSSFGQILTGTLNGAIPSGTTDGITLVANQRLLVKNETLINTPNNGIYVVTQAGSPSTPFILTRASDSNTPTLLAEATVSVSFGNSLSNTQWHCNPASVPIVIGTTYITFSQIGSGAYSFSPPLVDTGNIISIPAATNSVNGYLTSTDWSIFNNKQDSLGFTPENEANKENITLDTSTTKYPTNNLVKTNIDTKVTANSAITGDTKTKITYDSKGLVTSGTDLTASDIPSGITATKISNGYVTNAEFDFLSGTTSNIQTQINSKQNSLGYTPENEANKSSSFTSSSTTTYPNTKALVDGLATKVTANSPITSDTKTKITYDSKGLVTSGTDLTASDIPSGIDASKIADGSVSDTEFQYLNGLNSNIQQQINAINPVGSKLYNYNYLI